MQGLKWWPTAECLKLFSQVTMPWEKVTEHFFIGDDKPLF